MLEKKQKSSYFKTMNMGELFLQLNSQVEAEKVLWIQGPGGNSSFKKESILWVKPSGKRIRDIQIMDQLAQIQIEGLRKSLDQIYSGPEAEESYKKAIETNTAKGSPRPSMESGFHAWLPQTFVMHIHSIAGIGLAEIAILSATQESFLDWYQANWEKHLGSFQVINSCLPGFQLTSLITKAPPASLYFLRNHGVILTFQDADFLEKYKTFESEALKHFAPSAWELLQTWKQQDALELVEKDPKLLVADLKFYFPDMAIMYSRLQKYLKKTSVGNYAFDLSHNSSLIDLDALENWLASSMLQKLFSDLLPTLPQEVCDQIISLPTEIERKKVMEPKS